MDKILLFGGTFDPPHFGHIQLLESSIDTVNPKKIIIMPTGVPPHKYDRAANAQIRMKMCECFFPVFEDLTIDDEEIKRGGKSFTIDTVEYLKKKYVNSKVYFSIGSDMLLSFHKWHRYEELLESASIVVHCRTSDDIEPVKDYVQNLNKNGANILIASARIKEVSSTQIRDMVRENEDVSRFVPQNVIEIIKENNLYKKL